VPGPNELLAVPLSNVLWHPDIAVFANNSRTPAWYKKVTTIGAGLRRCYAVADYVRVGYTIPLWATLEIRPPLDSRRQEWDVRFAVEKGDAFKIEPFSEHDYIKYFWTTALLANQFQYQQSGECPVTAIRKRPTSNYIKLVNPWCFRTAPGYSTLFIPPIWEPNENYSTLAGVVNTDYYHHCNVVLNVTADAEFAIPEGTPMLHAIPFKREDGIKKSSIIRGDEGMHRFLDDLGFGTVYKKKDWFGHYKRNQAKIDKQQLED